MEIHKTYRRANRLAQLFRVTTSPGCSKSKLLRLEMAAAEACLQPMLTQLGGAKIQFERPKRMTLVIGAGLAWELSQGASKFSI